MEQRTIPPPQASARQTEMGDKFDKVLMAAVDALQESLLPYALIGGVAASGLGRPRSTHDIDIFVRPEDAEAAVEALIKKGFETERTDPRWLFKGWMDGMMVDLIFKSHGDIYFDTEMHQKARLIHYHGRDIPVVAPEDLVIIKAAVHSETGPHHWHDALAILSHANLDWDYLVKRARRATRRVLALLIYAQSNDIWIPNRVIFDLYTSTFGQAPPIQVSPAIPASLFASGSEVSANALQDKTYFKSLILERLASDPRTVAADLQVNVGGSTILVKGETSTPDHRNAIESLIRDIAQGFEVDNQVRVTEVAHPKVEKVL